MRRGLSCLAAVAVAGLAAGCGSSSSGTSSSHSATSSASTTGASSGGSPSGTLNMSIEADTSLNPTQSAPPLTVFPAYDPLIYQAADGSFEPDLATSWKFLDKDSTKFQVTLRSGVKFSDGSPLDAQAVVNSLEYVLKSKSHAAPNAGPVKSITAQGSDKVLITYTDPVPLATAELSLSENQNFGLIIGPKGIKDPNSLSKTSDGVGAYTLDAAASSPGVEYTYVANKAYFNQSAVRYQKVVVKVIENAATRLNAARSGELDYAYEMPASDVSTAKSAGLTTSEGGTTLDQVLLQNRDSGPLAKLAARQAVEYAINRAPIVKAIYGGIGSPWSTLGIKGWAGYTGSQPYSYDVAKAKALEAKAGYPHGFSFTVVDAAALDPNGSFGEAVAGELKAAGIDMKVDVLDAPLPVIVGKVMSKKFDGLILPFSASDIYTLYYQFLRNGEIGNPYGNQDPTLTSLIAAAAKGSSASAEEAGLEKVTERLDQLAWSAPVAAVPDINFVTSAVKNVPTSFVGAVLDPFSPETSQAWYGSGS